jgi:hypothetical protein
VNSLPNRDGDRMDGEAEISWEKELGIAMPIHIFGRSD